MTRQSRARWLAFATALLVVLLAAAFAWLRNPAPVPQPAAAPPDPATAAAASAGRAAFQRLGCSACHAAEGRGNPGLPLDGAGARLDRDALRAASFALGDAGARLPAAVAERKRRLAADPDAEAVVDYLQRLK